MQEEKIRRARTDGTPTDVICRYIPEGMGPAQPREEGIVSINFKAKSFGTMLHNAARAERDKVYDIRRLERESGKRRASLSTDDIDSLLARGATAVMEASIGAGRSSTLTRTLLLGVGGLGSKKIKGDIFVVIKVNEAPVEELTIKAKHEKELRAWALAFNKASVAPPAVQVNGAADALGRLNQLHDDDGWLWS
jgi:hypothetical protein